MPKKAKAEELGGIMSRPVLTLTAGQQASDAWAVMRAERVRHAVILRGKVIVGVISDRDLGGLQGGLSRRGKTVAEMMHTGVVLARPSMTIREAATLFRARRIGCLPVVERGRLLGIVTRTDLLAQLAGRGKREGIARRRPGEEDERRSLDVSPNIDKHL